jgi:hydrogenase maturation protein HypF
VAQKFFLIDKDGTQIDSKDPIREAGKLLEEGFIVAIKGNGGIPYSYINY